MIQYVGVKGQVVYGKRTRSFPNQRVKTKIGDINMLVWRLIRWQAVVLAQM